MPVKPATKSARFRLRTALVVIRLRVRDESTSLEGVGTGGLPDRGLCSILGRLAIGAQQAYRIHQDVADSPVFRVGLVGRALPATAVTGSEVMPHQGADQLPEVRCVHDGDFSARDDITKPMSARVGRTLRSSHNLMNRTSQLGHLPHVHKALREENSRSIKRWLQEEGWFSR
jgi:hypothetical protein